jgi:hypothetical protein
MDRSRMDRSSTDTSRTDTSRTDTSRTDTSRTDRSGVGRTDRTLDRATSTSMNRWMDRSEASALADLQMHWDEAYAIGLDGDVWSARFYGSADELRAHTSSELRELIRADYTYRTRADSARARREASLQRETSPQHDTSPQRETGPDADDSPGGYGAEAMAGYGCADEDAPAGPGRPDQPAEAATAENGDQQPKHTEFAEIRGERMST